MINQQNHAADDVLNPSPMSSSSAAELFFDDRLSRTVRLIIDKLGWNYSARPLIYEDLIRSELLPLISP